MQYARCDVGFRVMIVHGTRHPDESAWLECWAVLERLNMQISRGLSTIVWFMMSLLSHRTTVLGGGCLPCRRTRR